MAYIVIAAEEMPAMLWRHEELEAAECQKQHMKIERDETYSRE